MSAAQLTPGAMSPIEQELSTRLEQQELVAAFGMFALRGPDLEQVFDQACEIAARGLNTRYAKLLVYRPDSQDFLLRNGVGWKPGVVGQATVGADLASPAGYALRTRMPVVSNHLTGESRFRTPAVLSDHGSYHVDRLGSRAAVCGRRRQHGRARPLPYRVADHHLRQRRR